MATLNQSPKYEDTGSVGGQPPRQSTTKWLRTALPLGFAICCISYSVPIFGQAIATMMTANFMKSGWDSDMYPGGDQRAAQHLITVIEICAEKSVQDCLKDRDRSHALATNLKHQLRKDPAVNTELDRSNELFDVRLESMAFRLVSTARDCTARILQKYAEASARAPIDATAARPENAANEPTPDRPDLLKQRIVIAGCDCALDVLKSFVQKGRETQPISYRDIDGVGKSLNAIYSNMEDSLSLPSSIRFADASLGAMQSLTEILAASNMCDGLPNAEKCRSDLVRLQKSTADVKSIALEAHSKVPPLRSYQVKVLQETASIPRLVFTLLLFIVGSGSFIYSFAQARDEFIRSNLPS